jgi:hypothetical protein
MSAMMAVDSPLASFDDWVPREYLATYCARVDEDEDHTLRFLSREIRKVEGRPVALEFGSGPTVHHLLPIAPHVSEVHVADYLPANLDEVRKWQEGDPCAHDWGSFTEFVLADEGHPIPCRSSVARREALLRSQITRYFVGDARLADPLGVEGRSAYDLLISCYCVDSFTRDRATWRRCMANVLSLLRPGGFFLTAALRRCSAYPVGASYFPSANIDEGDFQRLFAAEGFDMESVTLQVEDAPSQSACGYDSIVLASGRRAAA